MSAARPAAFGASPIVDCGWYGDDKDTEKHNHLIVNARGRELAVPLGVTLLLHHVQKAIQAELGLLDESFEIYDVHGTRLRNDQDLRDAVMGGRTPLAAQVSDTTQRLIEDQREELAQIICQLIREHCNDSDVKLCFVCTQVDSLKAELEDQRRELQDQLKGEFEDQLKAEVQNMRNYLDTAIDSMRNLVASAGKSAAKADDTDASDSAPIASSIANLEKQVQSELAGYTTQVSSELTRLEGRFDEMTNGISGVLAEHEEYLTRVCANATEEVQAVADRCAAIDVRLHKAEKGMQERIEPKQRQNLQGVPEGSSQPGSFVLPLAAFSSQGGPAPVDAFSSHNPSARVHAASPLRHLAPPDPTAGRSKSRGSEATRSLARQGSSSTPLNDNRSFSSGPPVVGSHGQSHRIGHTSLNQPENANPPRRICLTRSRGGSSDVDAQGGAGKLPPDANIKLPSADGNRVPTSGCSSGAGSSRSAPLQQPQQGSVTVPPADNQKGVTSMRPAVPASPSPQLTAPDRHSSPSQHRKSIPLAENQTQMAISAGVVSRATPKSSPAGSYAASGIPPGSGGRGGVHQVGMVLQPVESKTMPPS